MFQLASVKISMHEHQLGRSCGAENMCAFLRLVAKTSDRFLELRMNIKFCLNLGKNASDTCAMLSEAYGEAVRKSNGFLRGINGLKMVTITWKIMKTVVVKDVTEPMNMLRNC
jgi:hypothetical protein